MKRLNNEVMSQAKACGICDEWYEKLREASVEEMLDMYKRGLDFVVGKNFLTNEFLLTNCDRRLLRENQIYVNEKFTINHGASNGVWVFNGNSNGEITFEGFAAATIHVRHNSDVVIHAEGMANVFISIYDNARVTVFQEDCAKVFVYRRGDNVRVQCVGDVRIRDKKSGG